MQGKWQKSVVVSNQVLTPTTPPCVDRQGGPFTYPGVSTRKVRHSSVYLPWGWGSSLRIVFAQLRDFPPFAPLKSPGIFFPSRNGLWSSKIWPKKLSGRIFAYKGQRATHYGNAVGTVQYPLPNFVSPFSVWSGPERSMSATKARLPLSSNMRLTLDSGERKGREIVNIGNKANSRWESNRQGQSQRFPAR